MTDDTIDLHDCEPATDDLRADVLTGLGKEQKELPCKLFYDEYGSALFDAICETKDYYPTRTEIGIMQQHGPHIARQIGHLDTLIEYGSGSSVKTRLLLDEAAHLRTYVPIDISREHLMMSAERISDAYEHLDVCPVCADYTRPFTLPPACARAAARAVYFPGSTIGNFEPGEAQAFLKRIAATCGSDGSLLIGVDLRKDRDVLERAYNDEEGVTAEFNLNALRRINDDLGANFELEHFEHRAFYNDAEHRIEMHLECATSHEVIVGDTTVAFEAGETIHTECSYKYDVDSFHALAGEAGFELEHVWTDEREYFSVQLLRAA